ncbi:MAG: amidohydrolase family protein [bacterium]
MKTLLFLTKWNKSLNTLIYRFYVFLNIGSKNSQAEIFKHLQGFYPIDTRFVVLSMDMEFMNAGKVEQKFTEQLDELAAIKTEKKELIHPFIFVHPKRKNIFALVRKYIEDHHFAGIKLYPPLGYYPFDERLDEIYEYAEKKQIPIISHCSRTGVFDKSPITKEMRTHPKTGERNNSCFKSAFTDIYTDPENYEYVLEKYPGLKICLAHFGGGSEWEKYLKGSFDHRLADDNWFSLIKNMIEKYENVYADISYTMHNDKFLPLLKLILQDSEKVRSRILYGSDFYMVELELSERQFSIYLRTYLGEEYYKIISEKNPNTFLKSKIC